MSHFWIVLAVLMLHLAIAAPLLDRPLLGLAWLAGSLGFLATAWARHQRDRHLQRRAA